MKRKADDMLSPQIVARMLDVSDKTVCAWIDAGKLPGFKLPSGKRRVRRDELEQWITSNRVTPPPTHTTKMLPYPTCLDRRPS